MASTFQNQNKSQIPASLFGLISSTFLYVSILLFVICLFISGDGYYGSLLAAYSTFSFGLLLMGVYILGNHLSTLGTGSSFSQIISVFTSIGPFILLFLILGTLLYTSIKNKAKIISGNVAPGYGIFTNLSVLFFILEIVYLTRLISSAEYLKTKKITTLSTILLYALASVNIFCTYIIYTVLRDFTTDG
jgi:hypothetical protein